MLALIAKICIDQVNVLTLRKNMFSMPGVVLTSHLGFHNSEDEDLGREVVSLKRHLKGVPL